MKKEAGGPLDGVRVIDLTSVVMGPFGTQVLCDQGADVIKVESPAGDVMRLSGPLRHADMGHYYLNINRGKRSIVLDLKEAAGREVVLRLAQSADVVVYSMRPQAMARLGLDYERLHAVNPRVIYAGAFGFSERGPYAGRPAYDDLIQGMIGIPWLSSRAGANPPRYAPITLVDRSMGLHLAQAVTAALFHRERTGRGQRIDLPMYEHMVSIVLGEHLAGKLFVPAVAGDGYPRSLTPNRGPFRTRDGWLCTLVYNDGQWRRFLAAVGRPEMFTEDPRFSSQGARAANIDAVYRYLAERLLERTTAEWVAIFNAADLPVAPMQTIDDILADPHLAAIGFFGEADHPTEGRIRTMAIASEWSDSQPPEPGHAPGAGEHTREVLAEAGYDAAAVSALIESGAAREPSPRG